MAHTRSFLIFGLLALAVVASGFLYASNQKEEVYLVYTIVIEADAEIVDSLHVGDSLIDACGKEGAGEILKITKEDALREDAFGVFPTPHRRTVALTLGGVGIKKEGEATIGTLTPRVGAGVYLLGGARLEGVCVKVRVI